jgi:hypothetical protein
MGRSTAGNGRTPHRPERGFATRYGVFALELAVAISVVVCAAACSSSQDELDEFRALPESELFYPGSEVITTSSRESERTFKGGIRACYDVQLGSDASVEEIEVFYGEELSVRGWSRLLTTAAFRSTGEIDAEAWGKEGVVFRLSFRRRTGALAPSPELLDRYESIYEIRLFAE